MWYTKTKAVIQKHRSQVRRFIARRKEHMKIVYSKSSLKFLGKLDSKSVTRIRKAIEGLTHTPPEGDIKAMKGYTDGTMRLRLGSWRIIYRISKEGQVEILYIIDIGNRGDIYK